MNSNQNTPTTDMNAKTLSDRNKIPIHIENTKAARRYFGFVDRFCSLSNFFFASVNIICHHQEFSTNIFHLEFVCSWPLTLPDGLSLMALGPLVLVLKCPITSLLAWPLTLTLHRPCSLAQVLKCPITSLLLNQQPSKPWRLKLCQRWWKKSKYNALKSALFFCKTHFQTET